jgi:anti-sigma-K factor RskA
MDRRALTHEEASIDLPAYLLGVLETGEASAISTHLNSCTACQEERARLELTLGLLGTAVPQFETPASLRGRVLDHVDATLPTSPLKMYKPRKVSRLAQFGLVAASLLIVGLAIWALALRSDLQQTRGQLDSANQQLAGRGELLADASRTIPMIADSATGAYGTLYIGDENNEAFLVVEKLPPTPSGRLYQIWLANGSSRVSAGLFTVNELGSAQVMVKTTEPISNYQTLGITSEPAPSGSQTPSGPRIIGCTLH